MVVFHSLNIGHRDTRLCPYLVSGNIIDLSIGPATVFFPTLLDAPPCLPPPTILDPEVHDALVIQYLTVSPPPSRSPYNCMRTNTLPKNRRVVSCPSNASTIGSPGRSQLVALSPYVLCVAALSSSPPSPPFPPPCSVADYIVAWRSVRNSGK